MCPYRYKACGTTREFTLQTGQITTIETKNLSRGEICSYSLRSPCGAPSFKIREDTSAANTKATVIYLEADTGRTAWNSSETSTMSTATSSRNTLKPSGQLATRNIQFANIGSSAGIVG